MSLLATVLSWRPYAWRKVTTVLDPSWQAGLAEAFERHVQWGPGLVFTFGPYGLVDNILPFYRLTALLAVLFALVVSWSLAALAVVALRPAWGLLGAGLVAWAVIAVAGSRTGYADLASATALGLALAIARSEPRRARLVLACLLAALTGVELLVKFNDGLVSTGLLVAAVVLASPPRPKTAAASATVLVGAVLVAWVGASQSLHNLWSYARGTFSEAVGYGSAMSLTKGRGAENWYAVVVLALLALVFTIAMKGRPRREKFATFVILAGWSWAALKEGFVRHDTHDLTFFGLAVVAIALARVRRAYLPLQVVAVGTALALACVAAGGPPEQLHSPGSSAGALADDVGQLAGFGGFLKARSTLRQQLLATGDALPAGALSLLDGHTIAVEPVQASIAYVYPQLDWRPEPVLQGYGAYTAYLDHLDASFLASSRAPERILYEPGAVIDDRDEWLDPPATLESMYCHYVQLAVTGPWQVLARLPGPGRCSHPELLSSFRAALGEKVAVPSSPGAMVVATFSFGLPLSTQVDAVLLKPPPAYLKVWTASAQPSSYRFVTGTAADVHVLSVPPNNLGYSAPFTPPAVRYLELEGGGLGSGAVTVRFYAVRLAPPGGAQRFS